MHLMIVNQTRMPKKYAYRYLFVLVLYVWSALSVMARPRYDAKILQRAFDYPKTIGAINDKDSLVSYTYTKYRVSIKKRNVALVAIPTMFYLFRDGKRDYFGEQYNHIVFYSRSKMKTRRVLNMSTVYNNHETLPVMMEFLQPNFYSTEMFRGYILSPLVEQNKRYYRFHSVPHSRTMTRFYTKPVLKNTQLVAGWMDIDNATGRMDRFHLEGEYDMIHFILDGTMGKEGRKSLLPKTCDISAKISVLGNKMMAYFSSVYDMDYVMPGNMVESHDRALMGIVRPMPLRKEEKEILAVYDSINDAEEEAAQKRYVADSIAGKANKKNWLKYVLWDVIGDNLMNRIHANWGSQNQGQLRIGPIFNPMYFSYSNRKGLVYMLDLRGNYSFTPNRDLSFRIKSMYSFKWRQMYFSVPLLFNFNKRRNGYVRMDFGNGYRINSSEVLERIREEHHKDTINWAQMNLDYFKDMNLRISVNYDVVADRVGLQGGFISHRRTAVYPQGFINMGRPYVYTSCAPYLQVQYRPQGDKGAFFTANYEHSFKGFCGSDQSYEKWEMDVQDILKMSTMRTLKLRAGLGFYTNQDKDAYFLDYNNFHENYIPNGWGDEWSGEFELLNSHWYNSSKYYVRGNATYESPLLFLSWIPVVGQVLEKERVYVSALAVENLKPYVEVGYGFTNRAFSVGVFTGWSAHHFEGVGARVSLELFNNW